jgi:hypothetical protein
MNKSPNSDFYVQNNRDFMVSLQELPDYPPDTRLLHVFRNISTKIVEYEDLDWMSKFDLINELRRLRKYHKDLFFTILNNYNIHKHILPELINSLRVNLAKVTLIFVYEIFNFYEEEHVNKWISYLIPIVIKKSVLDPNLKEISRYALQSLSENMFYEETILALLEEILNSNAKISVMSCFTLIRLINNYDIIVLENLQNWEEIFTIILENLRTYEEKRHQYKNLLKILNTIQNKLGKQIFLQVIQTNLNNFLLNLLNNYFPFEKFTREFSSRSKTICLGFYQQNFRQSIKYDKGLKNQGMF